MNKSYVQEYSPIKNGLLLHNCRTLIAWQQSNMTQKFKLLTLKTE